MALGSQAGVGVTGGVVPPPSGFLEQAIRIGVQKSTNSNSFASDGRTETKASIWIDLLEQLN
jgi:hypothetical protein